MAFWRRWLTLGVAIVFAPCLVTRTAHAGPAPSGGKVGGYILLGLAPHDVGVLITRAAPDQPYFSLGWTLQFPVTQNRRHRVVTALDWNPTWDGHRARGRLGYRVGWRYPFLGAAVVADSTGFAFAPEVGVRLVTSRTSDLDEADFAIHFIVRADIPDRMNDLRSVSVLGGWSLF